MQRHIAELDRFTRLDQAIVLREATLTNDVALATMIAGLLLKGGKKLDKQSSDQATEDYLDALEDLPAWAVREAVRKWNRGESIPLDPKKPHDFNWRPEPATLRRLSNIELAAVRARILHLQKLLDAVERIEFSDEHRKDMLDRMSKLLKNTVKPMAEGTKDDETE